MNIVLDGDRIHVMDRYGTAIEVRTDIWADIIGAIKHGGQFPVYQIQPTHYGVEWEGVPPKTGTSLVALRFTAQEWDEFCAQVRRGGFDFTLTGG